MAKNTIPPKSTVDPETVIKVVETAYNVLWSSIEIAAKAEEDPKLRAIFAVINFVHDGSFAGLSSAIGDTPAYANVGSTAVSITAGSWATGLAQRLEMAPIAGGIAATAIGVAAGFLINLEYNFINENQENIVNYFLNAGYTLDDTISRLSQAVESATQSGIDALDTAVVSAANALSGIPQYTEQFTQTLSSAVTQILGTVESSVDSAATTINDGAISLTQIISNINSSISSDVSAASDWISNATTALVSDPDAGANDTAALQALSDYTSANSDALPTDIASSVQSIEAVATGDPVALADGLTAQICSGGSITINSATDSGSVTGTYNLSGGLIAGDYELNDGTSQLTSYTVRGASITDDYSGPEGTGAITGIDVDSGNYDLSANISVDGTIEVIDGGTFVLSDGGDIASGCLSAASGGVFETGADQYATLNGVTIAAGTTFTGEDGSGTGLYGTIVNDGTLALTSTGDATVFSDGVQGLTLDGTGKVLLGSSGDCAIENLENSVWADPLVIGKGQTIEGSGSIYGSGSGAIDNQGTIVADYATALDVGSGVTNDGLMEADRGTLDVGGAQTTNNDIIEATSGTVIADGQVDQSADGCIKALTGSTVLLDGGGIEGGALTSVHGTFETGSDDYGTLNGVTIAAGTTFTGEDGSGTGLYGTIVNDGTLALTSTGDATVFSDGVQGLTLDGTGKVLLGSSGDCAIENLENSVWADPLVIGKGQTIEGSGSIYGSGSDAIDNQGTIVADYATALDVGSGVTNDGTMKADGGTLNVGGADVTNNGTIEAAFGSAVYISSDVGGDGAYDALGNSSSITFDTGVTVDGTIGVDDGANLVLDDTTITTDVSVGYDSSCYASGSVDNDSDMSFGSDDGDGGDPVFQAVGNTTLSGIGMLHLGSATQNFVYGPTGAGQTLIIGSAQTVEGSGLITDVKAGNILNEGTLIANHSAALSVGARVTNDGTIEASTGGVFDIEKPGLINDNIIEAIGGTVSAVGTITGARGVIDIGDQGAAVFSGAVDATQTVTFLDETGYLSIALRHSTSFSAEITGFQSGDIIDLKNVTNTTQSFARGALTFTDKTTHAIDAVLDFSGTPNFVFAGDNDGGTLIGDGYISASAVANSSKMKFESDKSVSNKSPIPYQASALTDRTFYSATDEFAALTLSPKGAELGSFAPYLALGAVAGAPPYLTHDGIGTVTLVRSGSFYPVWMFPNFH